jgi:mRNA-degrading endonuclease toxin of MazEF toxin-antitoxin module
MCELRTAHLLTSTGRDCSSQKQPKEEVELLSADRSSSNSTNETGAWFITLKKTKPVVVSSFVTFECVIVTVTASPVKTATCAWPASHPVTCCDDRVPTRTVAQRNAPKSVSPLRLKHRVRMTLDADGCASARRFPAYASCPRSDSAPPYCARHPENAQSLAVI